MICTAEGAKNLRNFAAVYAGTTSGFEVIHGLLDRFMEVLGHKFVDAGSEKGYYIRKFDGT